MIQLVFAFITEVHVFLKCFKHYIFHLLINLVAQITSTMPYSVLKKSFKSLRHLFCMLWHFLYF